MFNFQPPNPTDVKWLFKNTNELLKEIKQSDLKESRIDCSSLKDFKQVGSYNWSFKSGPNKAIMLIPGKASRLVSTLHNQQLFKSRNEQMCDENRYYMNEYPIEPMFRAVTECSPNFDFNSIDIVSDRNSLIKLFAFVEGKRKDSFRIDFQMIGNMLVLVRNDLNAVEFCGDYGKDFENKFTVDSGNHGAYRQIVTYKLGDFQILLRFKLECIEEQSQLDENNNEVGNELAASMASFDLNLEKPNQFENTKLHFIKWGDFKRNCKANSIELTTKAVYQGNYEFPRYKWSQLFFSNTDYLLVGWHKRGMLQKVEKLSFDQVTQKCEKKKNEIQSSMSKLNDLFHKLKAIALKEGDDSQTYSIIYYHESNEDALQIFKTSNQSQCLSGELVNKILDKKEIRWT
jgi:hypothetical protein